VLVTGPTGSGKTTTLYAALQELNTGEYHILTVEDPVEYRLDGIVQIQVHPAIDFGFAQALRNILRHDPDVILIVRSVTPKLRKIAIESALTGHLVTVHIAYERCGADCCAAGRDWHPALSRQFHFGPGTGAATRPSKLRAL